MDIRRSLIVGVFTFLFSLIFVSVPAYGSVHTEVLEGVYVLPVAELATTRTEPDIIEIENDLITIRVLPNRGRLLSSYILKDGEVPYLYQNYRPGPMVLPGGLHVVEFGGYFLSVPWNTRDRQPYDLEYEITRAEEELAEVYLWGSDMFLRTLTEAWVRVRENSPLVEIEVLITNTSGRREAEFDLSDFTVFDTGVDATGEQLLIPAAEAEILQSLEGWLGDEGDVLPWPDSLDRWTDIEKFIRLRAVTDPDIPAIGIYHPGEKAAMVKFWNSSDLFMGAEWWTWGVEFEDQRGADSYISLSSTSSTITLAPEESIGFTVYFAGFSDVDEDGAYLESLYQRALELH